jgi:hypothetical protein
MGKIMGVALAAFLAFLAGGAAVNAGDLAGDWLGTIGGDYRRVVVLITGEAQPGWKATLFSIDQSSHGVPVDNVTVRDGEVRMTVRAVMGSYRGTLSADGTVLTGTWASRGQARPLELRKVGHEQLWVTCIEPARTECHRHPGDDWRTPH